MKFKLYGESAMNQHTGHNDRVMNHHGVMLRDFRRRFIISTLFTVPILLFSRTIQGLLGFHLVFEGGEYVILRNLFSHGSL